MALGLMPGRAFQHPTGGICRDTQSWPCPAAPERAALKPLEETDVVALRAEIEEEIKLHPTLTLRGTFSLSTTTA